MQRPILAWLDMSQKALAGACRSIPPIARLYRNRIPVDQPDDIGLWNLQSFMLI